MNAPRPLPTDPDRLTQALRASIEAEQLIKRIDGQINRVQSTRKKLQDLINKNSVK